MEPSWIIKFTTEFGWMSYQQRDFSSITGNRATGVAAATAIVLLVLLIVLLWTGIGQDIIRPGARGAVSSPRRTHVNSTRFHHGLRAGGGEDDGGGGGEEEEEEGGVEAEEEGEGPFVTLGNKDGYVRKGQSPANERASGDSREYVRPMKISPLGLNEEDLLYGRDQDEETEPIQLRHHSGHFRHRTAKIWDPHPMYEFVAFQKNFLLVLEHDTGFASPDLKVTHIWHNSSMRRLPNFKSNGCFYKGYVDGDPSSSVAVSLCHGMTGNIRTSTGNYFIEPFEVTSDHAKPMEHVIYEMVKTGKNGQSHCGLDDYESLKFHMRKATSDARKKQESEMLFDYETDDHSHGHRFEGSDEREDYEVGGQKGSKKKRPKRSSSEQYFVEMLVVADSSMANYHGNNTANYILTLMYIVSGIFKDASIGNPITIAVVDLRIDYEVSYVKHRYYDHNGVSAAEMLREFCLRASKNSHMEYRHDTALLLTRENICRNASAQKCETLGLAELGTMCDKRSSCSLVQDNGLSAAFTIAHELGHVFNMPHDDAEIKCQNHQSRDSVSHVMSTSLKEGTNPWSWSECSRHFITEFLESRHSFCLRDPPVHDIIQTVPQDVFPGETILGNRQCELLYGEGSRVCSFMPVCSALWCNKLDSDSCQTLHMPWGDGTPCAQGAWCQKGVCVEKNRKALKKVDGGWGPWQSFGPCSRSCGGGIRKAVRNCNNPVPQNGGSYCIGNRVKYQSCGTKDCPDQSTDFRQEQCSSFDHNNHNIHGIPYNVKWVPKYGLLNDDRCVLYCRPEKGTLYYPLKDKVIDGTPCSPDSFDICVNGQCKSAGCDHALNSAAKLDLCGVCKGKNDTCRVIRGTFNELAREPGYRHVTIIPAGSSNLDIRQYGMNGERDNNFLVLSNGTMESKILNNGNVLTTSQKTIKYAGIILDYSGCTSGMERINSTRPLPKDLYLQVLSAANYTFPNISYQYTVPKDFEFMWKHDYEWEPCDKVCKGRRKRKMICYAKHSGKTVSKDHCRDIEEPASIYDECNTECTLRWRVVASPCSSNCGRGIRNLTKQCIQEVDNDIGFAYPVHNIACAHLPNPPPDFEECEGPCSTFDWEYGNWSACSKTCGSGIRKRAAACVDKLTGHHVDGTMCDPLTRVVEEECKTESCPEWYPDNWSKCSVTCGNGTRSRKLWCQRNNKVLNKRYCDPNKRPITEETCMLKRCNYWSVSEWSKCSTTCGAGKRRRTTVCKTVENKIVENGACNEDERPSDMTEDCEGPPCPPLQTYEDNRIPVKETHRRKGGYYKYPRWRTNPGECSVTCGTGIKKVEVRCVMKNDWEVEPSKCDPLKRPKTSEICEKPCPYEWVKSEWSMCSTSCGKGMQKRQVSCRNTVDGTLLDDRHCAHIGHKPETERGCGKPCRKFKWKYSRWSSCSATCGYGEKVRNLTCVNVTMESNEVDGSRRFRSVVEVDDKYCESKIRRKDRKKCRRKLCPLTWVEGEWSLCSKTCGRGTQTRNVTCHRVNMYDWLDPIPLKNESACNMSTRPSLVRNCTVIDCNSPYYWSPEEWQECTTPCGRKGTQRRVYTCRDRSGRLQDKSNCNGLNKPLPKSRPCNRRPCHPISCKEIQLHTNNRSDGEYMMLVAGKNMSIYCKGMNTASPEEYLTLHYLDTYSEFTDERLINHATCRRYSKSTRTNNCDCSIDNRYGNTTFHKVRLLVDTLQIVTDDFTFTETRGRRIPLGEAGGCCCRPPCKKGSFQINLNGVSLQVTAPMEKWVRKTSETQFTYSSEGFVIKGECGGSGKYGSCGSCGPLPSGRLKLHVAPP